MKGVGERADSPRQARGYCTRGVAGEGLRGGGPRPTKGAVYDKSCKLFEKKKGEIFEFIYVIYGYDRNTQFRVSPVCNNCKLLIEPALALMSLEFQVASLCIC